MNNLQAGNTEINPSQILNPTIKARLTNDQLSTKHINTDLPLAN